jgi:aminoglycoside phosphotransferase (APT) family kinase protein
MTDIVATWEDAGALEREPLVVLEPLAAFLDAHGLGSGRLSAQPIGDGHSNVTYLLARDDTRLVLRRPPRGPLAPSTHDVLREARLLRLLEPSGILAPEVLAACDDDTVIGAPFYVMPFVAGYALTTRLPVEFYSAGDPVAIATQLVDALVALHAVPVEGGLVDFGRPDGYLERQVRRFRGLLEISATRPLPDLETVAEWLAADRPSAGPGTPGTVVHGDYRLGNVLFAARPGPRLTAILDWELATLGDPLADVGYLTAMWAESDDPEDPMLALSAVTRSPRFPTRAQLVERYVDQTGRDANDLRWYQVLAIWKSAIFLEGSYRRHQSGSTDDPYFARLAHGVPALGRRARALMEQER